MTDHQAKVYGERWQVLRTLGKGGQGIVYEVEDISALRSEEVTAAKFKDALREAMAVIYHQGSEEAIQELIRLIKRVSATTMLPRAALKELLPIEEVANE